MEWNYLSYQNSRKWRLKPQLSFKTLEIHIYTPPFWLLSLIYYIFPIRIGPNSYVSFHTSPSSCSFYSFFLFYSAYPSLLKYSFLFTLSFPFSCKRYFLCLSPYSTLIFLFLSCSSPILSFSEIFLSFFFFFGCNLFLKWKNGILNNHMTYEPNLSFSHA